MLLEKPIVVTKLASRWYQARGACLRPQTDLRRRDEQDHENPEANACIQFQSSEDTNLGLGLIIPCLLRVTMSGGEDRGSVLEEDKGKWGWQCIAPREADPVEWGGALGWEDEGTRWVGVLLDRVRDRGALLGQGGEQAQYGAEAGKGKLFGLF